jgi:hypothetical protein
MFRVDLLVGTEMGVPLWWCCASRGECVVGIGGILEPIEPTCVRLAEAWDGR